MRLTGRSAAAVKAEIRHSMPTVREARAAATPSHICATSGWKMGAERVRLGRRGSFMATSA